MKSIISVTIENNKTGEVKVIKADYLDTPDKTKLFELGRYDETEKKMVYQLFNTYIFSVIDIEYKDN